MDDKGTGAGSDRSLTISELEAASGIPRRTIHYYLSRDLLPPSEGSGPNARYTEEHLVRLRMITVLKESNIRLEGIRKRMSSMTFAEMKLWLELAEGPEATEPPTLTLDWAMQQQRMLGPPASAPSDEESSDSAALRESYWKSRSVGGNLEDSATWRRLPVLPGLEIHFQPELGSAFMKKMRALMRAVRTIFADELKDD